MKMSSDEDEDFARYGTPLDPIEEDNVVKKKPRNVEDQVAKDKYGRRRFHGAFTGGFSAGFFNSVGTPEGWTPSSFKSSRGTKAPNKNSQKPEDFMDDEDMGEFGIAPKLIRLKDNYDGGDDTINRKRKHFVSSDSVIPGQPILQKLLEPVKSTVGVRLLKRMGWKVGQGVGPRLSKIEKQKQQRKLKSSRVKVYGCSLPETDENVLPHSIESSENDDDDDDDDDMEEITFAPDDYDPYIVKTKDNCFGIGYSGLDRRSILSSHINLFEPSFTVKEKAKKFSIRGQGFGVGALEEEDEDIYSCEDMSQYDFTLESKPSSSKRPTKQSLAVTSGNEPVEGFVAANIIIRKKFFPPPKLPPGFLPIHVTKKSRFEPAQVTQESSKKKQGLLRHDLTANERAIILDEPLPSSSVVPDVATCEQNTSVSHDESSNNEKLQIIIKTEKSDDMPTGLESNVQISSSVFKPFVSNPDKQRRYEQYLKLVKLGQKDKLSGLQPLSMTEWERERERVEFEQAERLYRPISAVFNDRFVSAVQPDDSTNPLAEVQRTIDDQKDMKEAARMKMFGKLTRKVYLWSPSSLLCKRFNIRDPERSHGLSEMQVTKKRPKFSVFNFLEAATSNIISKPSESTESTEDIEENISSVTQNNSLEVKSVVSSELQSSNEKDVKEEVSVHEKVEEKKLNLDDEKNKEDLYKAIFLSSSDESDDEEKEVESHNNEDVISDERIKNKSNESPLWAASNVSNIQQALLVTNVLRNTSPPRGIFANLDLDMINSRKTNKVGGDDNSKNENYTKTSGSDEKQSDKIDVSDKDKSDTMDPLLYGPKLPSNSLNIDKNVPSKSKMKETIIIDNSDSSNSDSDKDEWVEEDKIKKHKTKKKKKHKSKHKKHKKHKKEKH